MGYAIFISLALAACQVPPPAKPDKSLDPKDPGSVVQHAVFNTRSQKSYETRFKATLTAPGSDPIQYDGQSVWAAPSVLFIQYSASGGDHKKGVRAGAKDCWVWHTVAEEWVTAEEAGLSSFARGLQNPDEVLSVLARHTGGAKIAETGAVRITLSGNDIEQIMREQAQSGAFDWAKSTAAVVLRTDAENRLKQFTVEASLTSTDPNVKGEVKYAGQVDVVAYNGARTLKFTDEKNREIPLNKDIQTAIDRETK